jgi:hypothetical protein
MFRMSPAWRASSASCWPRPGRNPWEKPRSVKANGFVKAMGPALNPDTADSAAAAAIPLWPQIDFGGDVEPVGLGLAAHDGQSFLQAFLDLLEWRLWAITPLASARYFRTIAFVSWRGALFCACICCVYTILYIQE